MKNFLKGKTVKVDMQDIVTSVQKVVERLDALEKKMDLVLARIPVKTLDSREAARPVPRIFVPQTPVPPQASRQPDIAKPAQAQPQRHPRERRERVLHKAVCAECQKDCEIPFKPSGERPVYCKECFSNRKAGNPPKGSSGNNQEEPSLPPMPAPANPPQRRVIVTKKGVGKVTISEIPPPSEQDKTSGGKKHLAERNKRR